MKWINRLYILFLGIVLTITTGFGVAAFYPQPIAPQYPSKPYVNMIPKSCNETPQSQSSPECQQSFARQQEFEQENILLNQRFEDENKAYQNKNAGYTRTAIFMGIVIGIFFAVIGLSLIHKSKLVATGMLLAGVLTALLTRILIALASLGASVSGTATADITGYIEFGILFILSILVVFVGLYVLKDQEINLTS